MKDLEFSNIEVFGLNSSIKASGLPMTTSEFNGEFEDSVNEKDITRSVKLGGVKTGTGHDNYLKGIVVQFNILYPVFWTPQLQRYNFVDIVSSQSTMHRITKTDLDTVFQSHTSKRTINYIKRLVDIYNDPEVTGDFTLLEDIYNELWPLSSKLEDNEMSHIVVVSKPELFHIIVKNLPQSQTKWMRVSTNYLQLKTIYLQRRHHKLPEWSKSFVEFCESLPEFKRLIGIEK